MPYVISCAGSLNGGRVEKRQASPHPVAWLGRRMNAPPLPNTTSLYPTAILCISWNVHTTQNTPVLVRSPKISWVGPDQYYVEESRGNPG